MYEVEMECIELESENYETPQWGCDEDLVDCIGCQGKCFINMPFCCCCLLCIA
ncbi:MAG: hypothetical protein ACE5KE_01120 [Methanosarcinales archaeon]